MTAKKSGERIYVAPLTLTVNVGDEARDNPTGDFINALGELIGYFESPRCMSRDAIVNFMEAYTKTLREEL